MSARCELDGFTIEVEIGSLGQTIISCPGCVRRRAHQCMDCGAPVRGKSWRCEAHKVARRAQHSLRYDKRNKEHRRKGERRRYRALSQAGKAEYAASKKRWRDENRLACKLQKRKGRLDRTWGYTSREKYLSAQQMQNDRRRLRKREQMKELNRQRSPYRDHGPTCRQCGADVAFNGVGRPRLDCFDCRAQVAA